MQFSNTAFLALFFGLAAITAAAPVNEMNTDIKVDKRQQRGETVYLTNCGSVSEFSYYRPGHNSEDTSPPDDICVFNTGNNLPINWENSDRRCTFGSSGVTFESQLGDVQIPNQFAGGAIQTIPGVGQKPWNCFRDNLRLLYRKGSVECKAVYWCNPR